MTIWSASRTGKNVRISVTSDEEYFEGNRTVISTFLIKAVKFTIKKEFFYFPCFINILCLSNITFRS